MKDKSKESFVKTGINRPGRNESGPHVIERPDKRANQARQTSDGKPPVGTHHSGVKVQRRKKGQ